MSETHEFRPAWASNPARTIRLLMEHKGISTAELREQLHLSAASANAITSGEVRISEELAKNLASTLGGSASFWLMRDQQYAEDLERLHRDEAAWLRAFPLRDMHRYGWLSSDATNKLASCLAFFGVTSIEEWRENWLESPTAAAYRTSPSFETDAAATAAWLRQGEVLGAAMACDSWSKSQFAETLNGLRALTRQKNPSLFIPELQRACKENGVAVVVVRAPSGCRASGATRFLAPNKPLLQLSFRHLSDDQFWFTFFHEAAHLILHAGESFVDFEGQSVSPKEREADEFASNVLIPPSAQSALDSLGANALKVIRFARDLGISPGIVVGQLQHRGLIPRNTLNSLKRRFTWSN